MVMGKRKEYKIINNEKCQECSTCNTWKSLFEFKKAGEYKDGQIQYRSECKVCESEYNKNKKIEQAKVTKAERNKKKLMRETEREIKRKEKIAAGKKECKQCNELKQLSEYGTTNKPNGIIYYKNKCKVCEYENSNKKRRKGTPIGRPSVYLLDENGTKYRECTECSKMKPVIEFQKKGNNSKGIKYDIICKKCYATSPIKDDRNKFHQKYMHTPKMKKWKTDYYNKQEVKHQRNNWQRNDRKLKPDKYSRYDEKHLSKRRGLDITRQLNRKFKDSRGHHLLTDEDGIPDNGIVFYIQKEAHITNHHEDTTGEGMIKINEICLIQCYDEHNKNPSKLTKKNIVILKKIIKKTKARVKSGWISYRGATKEEICAYIGLQNLFNKIEE